MRILDRHVLTETALAGGMAGLSSLTGPLLIAYLLALRLPREVFVGSISIIYLLGAVPMYGAMLAWGRFGWAEVAWSCLALLPMHLGLALGTRVRQRIDERLFRRLLLGLLIGIGLMLMLR